MARDMHDLDPLPAAPEGAVDTRVKPDLPGVLFGSIASAVMLNGFYALDGLVAMEWIDKQVGGHFQFLTIIGLFASLLTMSLSTLSSLLPSLTPIALLRRLTLLLSLPISFTISAIYWSLLLLAPGLILPPAEESGMNAEPSSSGNAPAFVRIPLWIDLSLHAVPAIVLTIQFFMREKKYKPPMSTSVATVLSIYAAVGYGTWAEYCASYNGSFPYPFLTMATLPVRCAIYVGATAFALGVFRVLNGLHR